MVGLGSSGHVALRRRMRRDGIVKPAAGLPARVVAMEVCCGAHHLGRPRRGLGHHIRLMSPEYVRPYVLALGAAAVRVDVHEHQHAAGCPPPPAASRLPRRRLARHCYGGRSRRMRPSGPSVRR